MWDVRTIVAINEKAVELHRDGKPTKDALMEAGIDSLPKKSHRSLSVKTFDLLANLNNDCLRN